LDAKELGEFAGPPDEVELLEDLDEGSGTFCVVVENNPSLKGIWPQGSQEVERVLRVSVEKLKENQWKT
jgi:hypothetical protein